MNNWEERTCALAAVVQAAAQVHRLAYQDTVEETAWKPLIEGIFSANIKSAQELYSTDTCREGLVLLGKVLDSRALIHEKLINRYWFSLLYLANKLRNDKKKSTVLREALKQARRQYEHFGPLHEATLLRLGDIYHDTVGHYRFKIVVAGNHPNFKLPLSAAKIRATLLAGIRAAILWEQVGGKQWHLFLMKKKMMETARGLLKERVEG